MSLASWTLLAYCIVLLGVHTVHAVTCFSCASPSLKENWEVTGLPAAPTNSSIFAVDDCMDTRRLPKVTCGGGGCFFGTFASISGEYLVVRGCVDEFLGDTGIPPNSGIDCEYASSNRPVTIDDEPVGSPLVGWFTCNAEDTCNNWVVDHELTVKVSRWTVGTQQCKEPEGKPQCVSCHHFDGVGRCHHNSKTICQGNYCTKLVGKLNNRWFEIRDCTPMIPLRLQTCIGYQKTLVIEQLGTVMNQSYWATNCVCKGERCNSSTSHFVSFTALFLCALFLFKITL